MTLETAFDLPFWFEFAATVTGGLSGGMSAVRARYDIFGTVAIACITGMGGGIIRDILLQNYGLYAFQSPWFLLSCALAGVAVFYFGKLATYLAAHRRPPGQHLGSPVGHHRRVEEPLGGPYRHPLSSARHHHLHRRGHLPRRAHEPSARRLPNRPHLRQRGPYRLHGLLPAEGQRHPARHGGHPVRRPHHRSCATCPSSWAGAPSRPATTRTPWWKAWRGRCASSRARCTCPWARRPANARARPSSTASRGRARSFTTV